MVNISYFELKIFWDFCARNIIFLYLTIYICKFILFDIQCLIRIGFLLFQLLFITNDDFCLKVYFGSWFFIVAIVNICLMYFFPILFISFYISLLKYNWHSYLKCKERTELCFGQQYVQVQTMHFLESLVTKCGHVKKFLANVQ